MIFSIEEITASLPWYEFGDELGRGGYAVVFAARERATGRRVAVKVLVADADEESAADARRRFQDEAEILTRLRHPHLVDVYRYVETDRIAAIVMELLGGGDLRDQLRHGLSVADSCAIAIAAAEALGLAHQAGVLHRDVKPHNILFTAHGIPKVSDFGIAKVLDASVALPSAVIGTPRYMAPEQFDLRPVGPATDLYALGMVAYELLAGRLPFDERSGHNALMLQHLNTTPPPLDGVPAPIADVVLRALSKDPRDRQPSMRAFALSLATAATGVLGPGWPQRASVRVELDETLLAATTTMPAGVPPAPADVATPQVGAGGSGPRRPVDGPARSTGARSTGARSAVNREDPLPAPQGRGRHPAGHGRLAMLGVAGLAVVVLVAALLLHRADGRTRQSLATGGVLPAAVPAGLMPGGVLQGGGPGAGPTTSGPGPTGPLAAASTGAAGSAATASATPTGAATTPPAQSPPVVILNASAVKGLGEDARRKVQNAGFTVDEVATYNGATRITVTTVLYGDGLRAAARTLRNRVAGIAAIQPYSGALSAIAASGKLILVVTEDFAGAN